MTKHCPSCTCVRVFYMDQYGSMWERVTRPDGTRAANFVGIYRRWFIHLLIDVAGTRVT